MAKEKPLKKADIVVPEKSRSTKANTTAKPKNQKKQTSNLKSVSKHWWGTPLRVAGFFVLAFLLVTVSFAGAAFAYQNEFEGKALYGSKILGQDMGGLTKKEIQRKIHEALGETTFRFTVDGTDITAKPADVGITYREEITAENAYNLGRHQNIFKNLALGAISLTYKVNEPAGGWLAKKAHYKIYQNVTVDYKIDETKIDAFTKKVSAKFNTKSQDAGLVMKGDTVKVIPAVYGRAVATESIKAQIKQALATGDSTALDISVAEVKPEIIETEAADSIAAAEEILNLNVSYSYDGRKYIPTKEVIGSWIVFKKSGKKLVPLVDSAKVQTYLNTIAKNINVAAVNQKVKLINGGKREITREGKNGLAVDVRTAAAKTATSLNAGDNSSLALTTYTVKYKTEFNNVLVANWDKYIEVNITTQRMCAYLKNGEKVNCWAITTGQYNVINGVSTRTPTGTFLIRRKSGAGGVAGGPGGGGVCMPNPPYDTPLCGINYVSTFTPQGHAIHEAWWRTSFGTQAFKWNGSHGCVNSPYAVAKFIYNWAPIGTPVVIHY